MNEAGISLPQVLLMSHVERRGAAAPTDLAKAMHVSLPAVSQMVDRLVQQELLARKEDPDDRRRKSVAITPASRSFLRRLEAARSKEYGIGLAAIPSALLAEMTRVVERVAAELETEEGRSR